MRAERNSIAIICIGLAGLTLAAYWPVTTCEFVNYDDMRYVTDNAYVLRGLSWSGWMYAWTTLAVVNWHPLTMLSLELDGSFWGSNPLGYHVTNLIFHSANVLLVFLVLRQMTGRLSSSACVAAFFALHPLHVESVAWVSERKDVLSTFFLVLTLWAYVFYATRPSLGRYLLVAVMLSLGLTSKPMLVTLPILLLLLDYWPLNRIGWMNVKTDAGGCPRCSIRFLIVEKLPWLCLSLIVGLLTIFAQDHTVSRLSEVGFASRIGHTFYAYSWYLQKTFVPTQLVAFYEHPGGNLSWWHVGIGVLVFFAMSAWAVLQASKKPHLFLGWAWFVISLLPVIGLLQVGSQAYADRYAYIPHIGLFVFIVWEVQTWATTARTRRLMSVFAVLALFVCGLLTHVQVQYWKNSVALWEHALEVFPDLGMAETSLGSALLARGDYEQALPHFERGLQLTKLAADNTYCNWGRCLLALNRPDEAEQKFLAALTFDDHHEFALLDLQNLLVAQGRHAEAARVAAKYNETFVRRTVKDPSDYKFEVERGLAQIQKGDVKQAAVHFEKAVQLAPQSAAAHVNLATAQLQLRLLPQAKAHFLKALELNPGLAEAHFNLACILEVEPDLAGAKQHFLEAFRLNPNDVEAKQHLDRLPSP